MQKITAKFLLILAVIVLLGIHIAVPVKADETVEALEETAAEPEALTAEE